ncbi:MAG: helix-turn-helix domain-containing protein [Corynebacterium sp.]|uniref:helix-turn-helix domain-containing protein n=1 Tax=Corynebacterium sp. TaxID=1720 RepID=UPI0026DECB3B|nr:helix-turn-helix domain-containing protein [Corynebacterium sp.]MDO5669454.1 helix-turn-helix domain-containing protein [Corynebacterium sp.]
MSQTLQRPITVTPQAAREAKRAAEQGGALQLFTESADLYELEKLLKQVIAATAAGATVTVGTLPAELSTTEAARQLGISRPTLMKMIRNNQIEAHKVGTHHRLLTSHVLQAKEERRNKARAAFDAGREDEDELVLEP